MARGLKEEKRECRACRGWGKVQSVVFWVPLFVLLWQEAQPRTWSLSSRQAGKGVGHAGGAAKGMSFEYYTPSISENVLLAEGRRFLEAQTLEPLSSMDPSNGLLVAHCIAGAARTLDRKETYSMYKSHAIDPLDAPSVVFMVLESDLKTNTEVKVNGFFRGDPRGLEPSAYQPAFNTLRPAGVVWLDDANDDIYKLLDDNKPRQHWERPLLTHPRRYLKKHHVCYRMVRFYEHKHNVQFSHIVVTRPDVMLPIPIGPAAAWPVPHNSSHVMTALYNTINTLVTPSVSMWEEVPIPTTKNKAKSGRDYISDAEDLLMHATDIFNVLPRAAAHTLLDGWREPCCYIDEKSGDALMGDRVFKLTLDAAGLQRSFRAFKFKIMRSGDYCQDMAFSRQTNSSFMFVAYC